MVKVVIFTNCQGRAIYENWLRPVLTSVGSSGELHVTTVDAGSDSHQELLAALSAGCDIFIYQPVSGITAVTDGSGPFALLSPTCKRICFPSIYYDGWPLYFEKGLVVGGGVIQEYRELGRTLDELLDAFERGALCFRLADRVRASTAYMRERERAFCNIVVSDFIDAHARRFRLFDTQNHPNGIILCHVAKQICAQLGLQLTVDEFTQGHIHLGTPIVCWPWSDYIQLELGLEYGRGEIPCGKMDYSRVIAAVYNKTALIKYK